jgi:hypothetical protein
LSPDKPASDPIIAATDGIKRGLGLTRNWIINHLYTGKAPQDHLVAASSTTQSLFSMAIPGSTLRPANVSFEDPGRTFDYIIPVPNLSNISRVNNSEQNTCLLETNGFDSIQNSTMKYFVVDKEHGRLLLLDTFLGLVTCTVKGLRGYEIELDPHTKIDTISSDVEENICLVAYHSGRMIIDTLVVNLRSASVSITSRRNVRPRGLVSVLSLSDKNTTNNRCECIKLFFGKYCRKHHKKLAKH